MALRDQPAACAPHIPPAIALTVPRVRDHAHTVVVFRRPLVRLDGHNGEGFELFAGFRVFPSIPYSRKREGFVGEAEAQKPHSAGGL
jgi:hypothetical protein